MHDLTNDQPVHDISVIRTDFRTDSGYNWSICRLDTVAPQGFAYTRATVVATGHADTRAGAIDAAQQHADAHGLTVERVINPAPKRRTCTAEIVQHPLDPCWTWVILERDTSHATHFDAIVAESEDEHATALDARAACHAAAEANGLLLVLVRDVRRESPAPARKLAA